MVDEALIRTLESMEFTHGLKARHLEKLASMAREVSFPEGTVIFREGDTGDEIYLVKEGQVALDLHVPGRGRVTLLTIGPGQILGWSALFPPQRKTATARAMTPVQAIAINATQLRGTCLTAPTMGCPLGWRVAEAIASRLNAAYLHMLDVYAPGSQG
jgi:CRP-like cAMP-binding protein